MFCLNFIENEERLTKSKQTASLWYLKTQYGLKWPKERDFKGKELGGRGYYTRFFDALSSYMKEMF